MTNPAEKRVTEKQNTDDRAGQYLWAGNIIATNPRYNFWLTNIPTLS